MTQPYLPNATPEEIEVAELINWLYAQPWGTVGGPLHIVTDDQNIEDGHLDFCHKAVDEGRFDELTDEEKGKCRRILELLKAMPEDRREPVLWHAEALGGPY